MQLRNLLEGSDRIHADGTRGDPFLQCASVALAGEPAITGCSTNPYEDASVEAGAEAVP